MPWDFCLIFFVLGVLLPWRGYLRLQKMLAIPHMSARERLGLYFSTIAFQWLAVAVVAWRAWARGLTLEELGLVVHGHQRIFVAAIVGAATLGGLQWLNLRRMGRTSGEVAELHPGARLPDSAAIGGRVSSLPGAGGYGGAVRGVSLPGICDGGVDASGTACLGRRAPVLSSLWDGAPLPRPQRACKHTAYRHSIRNGANRVRWDDSGNALAYSGGCGGGSGGAAVSAAVGTAGR